MTSFERFESRLPALLDELSTPRPPDYAHELFARTAATRQRPGWAFRERWLPMTAFSGRIAATTPRIPWRLGAVLALLAVAAVAAVLVAGTLLRHVPSVGPGRNGVLLLADKSGQILAVDPSTGTSRTILTNTTNTRPIVSPDGSKFLVLRAAQAGQQNIFVVDLQGNETLITPDALTAYHYVGFAPDGNHVLLLDDGGRLLLLDATKAAPPVSLSKGLGMGKLWVGDNFNDRSANAFRPPSGDEVLFMAEDGRTLATVRTDGTGARTLLDVQAAHIGVSLGAAEWSPDGSQIVFELQRETDGPNAIYVVNADGSNPHLVYGIGDQWSPMWSPDGRQIAFERWTPPADGGQGDWDYHPITILDVASGATREVGNGYRDGYLSWDWSPDGKSIVETPKDGVGNIVIVDVATGAVTPTTYSVDQAISWQRLEK